MKKTEPNLPISHSFVNDIRLIIEQGRRQAYAAVGNIVLATYWEIGQRIVEEEQNGQTRAQYGSRLISDLADNLKKEYGAGYGKRNLAYFRKCYLSFSNLEILHELVQNLTWTHIRSLFIRYRPDGPNLVSDPSLAMYVEHRDPWTKHIVSILRAPTRSAKRSPRNSIA